MRIDRIDRKWIDNFVECALSCKCYWPLFKLWVWVCDVFVSRQQTIELDNEFLWKISNVSELFHSEIQNFWRSEQLRRVAESKEWKKYQQNQLGIFQANKKFIARDRRCGRRLYPPPSPSPFSFIIIVRSSASVVLFLIRFSTEPKEHHRQQSRCLFFRDSSFIELNIRWTSAQCSYHIYTRSAMKIKQKEERPEREKKIGFKMDRRWVALCDVYAVRASSSAFFLHSFSICTSLLVFHYTSVKP